MELHTQVLLEKNGARETAWIPKDLAKPNTYVKLKKQGEWDDGWLILEAYKDSVMSSEYIREHAQDYKKMPSTKQKMGD